MGFMDKLKGAAQAVADKASSVTDQLKAGQEVSNKIKELTDWFSVSGETLPTAESIQYRLGYVEDPNNVETSWRYLVYRAEVSKIGDATLEKYSILDEFTDDDIDYVKLEPHTERDLKGLAIVYDYPVTIVLENGVAYSFSPSIFRHYEFRAPSSVSKELEDWHKVYGLLLHYSLYMRDQITKDEINRFFEDFAVDEENKPLLEDGHLNVFDETGLCNFEVWGNLYDIVFDALKKRKDVAAKKFEEYRKSKM